LTVRAYAAALIAAAWLFAPSAHAQEAPQGDASAVVQAIVTGYATGADGGNVGSMTATGTLARWGTVAADWRLYPPGTRVRIEGFPDDVFTVEDSGGAVRGNIFDIWFPDLATASAFGTKSLKVTVLASSDR
jgi:3D (Asp-Asp-Asp) domain-containing protein